MLTLPTRAKYVEGQLSSSQYGAGLISELSLAMIQATREGRLSVRFKFSIESINNKRLTAMNVLFIDYVETKKYKVFEIDSQGFTIKLIK